MRVLSIDLDYITGPYSKFITKVCSSGYSGSPNVYWDDIEVNYGGIFNDFRVNFESLLYIFETFNKSFLCSKKVVFSLYHDCLLHEILEYKDLDIINIDMHHDIYYNDSQIYGIDKLNYCNESNWVMYLSNLEKLKSYTWIRDSNSRLPDEKFLTTETNFYYKLTQTKEYSIDSYLFDLVFVCLSPQYIAPAHWHYFEILKNNYKNITGKEPLINNKRFKKDFDITKNNSGLTL